MNSSDPSMTYRPIKCTCTFVRVTMDGVYTHHCRCSGYQYEAEKGRCSAPSSCAYCAGIRAIQWISYESTAHQPRISIKQSQTDTRIYGFTERECQSSCPYRVPYHIDPFDDSQNYNSAQAAIKDTNQAHS